jgi:hypothetical protein
MHWINGRAVDVIEIVTTGRMLVSDKKELIFRDFWGWVP